LENIFQAIDTLELACKDFLEIQENNFPEQDITLQIKAFNQIIIECKAELNEATFEHKKTILKKFYNTDIDTIELEELDIYLDNFIDNSLQSNNQEINEEKIIVIKEILSHINLFLKNLKFQYDTKISKQTYSLHFPKKPLEELNSKIVQLRTLKRLLEEKLENLSKLLSDSIIENFYTFYIYFSFLLQIPKIQRNELLLLKMANIIDRYINIIEPTFNNRSLQHKDMIYHYAIYELEELKTNIFSFFS